MNRLVAVLAMVLLSSIALMVPTQADSPKAVDGIVYATIGNRSLHMNLTLPSSDISKRRPAVLWIHGGGWMSGDYREDPSTDYGFTKAGFVTGTIEYRLSEEAKYPAQIWDCKAAIRYLRANAAKYGIDPNRIGVWGGSAGGHLVALLDTTGGVQKLEGSEGVTNCSSRVQAVCDLYGPTDFTDTKLKDELLPPVMGVINSLLGGPVEDNMGLARLASPLEFVSKDDAPILILHGEDDVAVPIRQSELFYAALKKSGVDATFIRVKHAGHGFGAKENDPSIDQIQKTVLEFFKKHLVAKQPKIRRGLIAP